MAELTATHFRSQKVRRIGVANRTASHATTLAARIDGDAVAWENISSELASSDIAVTATGSASPILTRNDVAAAMKTRRVRPLFIIDIGVPRDVEPASGEIEQVFLYNIDDLQAIADDYLRLREEEVAKCEAIIHAKAKELIVLHEAFSAEFRQNSTHSAVGKSPLVRPATS